MISYLALAAAMQAAAPAGAPPTRARPRLGSYFAPADYPDAARAAGEHGRVDTALAIGANGRVTGCTVLRSSGSAALDSATCRILRSRARYTPARDAAGAPVPGYDIARLTWGPPESGSRAGPTVLDEDKLVTAMPILMLPPAPPPPVPPPPGRIIPPERARANLGSYFSTDDYPAAALRAEAEGEVRFTLTIGSDGRVHDCVVTASSGSPPLDSATCRIMRSRARYTPARDHYGNPTTGTDRGVVRWRLPPPPPPPEPAEPALRTVPKPA